MEVEKLIRKNIKSLLPYSTARDEADQGYSIYLDANESPFNNGMNRYPDPHQGEFKKLISSIKGVPCERIFAANGSDEAIDLLYRIFCEPRRDNAVAISPSYGMYGVAAAINNVEFRGSCSEKISHWMRTPSLQPQTGTQNLCSYVLQQSDRQYFR